MGGPSTLNDVEPFLYNLFMDPDIIEIPLVGRFLRPFIARKIAGKRSAKVRGYYEKIGGGSPLLKLTLDQAAALERALADSGNFSTYVAMRYWHPFTEETVKKVLAAKPNRVILLPLYPQYSATTSGSSINEFHRVWKKTGEASGTEILDIRDWHDHKGYIDAWTANIEESLKSCGNNTPHLIFSAHGIPVKRVERGDPYRDETEETVRLIVERLKWKGEWSLTYQSRVGPVKWLEPATDLSIEALGREGTKNLLMVPISFVSDHSETLYEMDILYKELAESAGIERFERVASLNSGTAFIEALRDIILATAGKD